MGGSFGAGGCWAEETAIAARRRVTVRIVLSVSILSRVRMGIAIRDNLEIAMRFPERVVPMAATLTQDRFTGPDWIFERKYDGIRLLAFRRGNTVRLFS